MQSDRRINGVLVVPCFNEEHRLKKEYFYSLISELQKFDFELFFVNDGSKDSTAQILDDFTAHGSTVLHLKKNVGKAEALRQGFIATQKNHPECGIYGYLDADAAFRISDVLCLVNAIIQSYSDKRVLMLSGARVSLAGSDIRRSKFRHLIGRVIVTYLNLSGFNRMYDPQSGLKLIRVESPHQLSMEENFKTRWFVDLEILERLKTFSVEVIEVPVKSWTEVGGSKLKPIHVLNVLHEILIIKRLNKRKSV